FELYKAYQDATSLPIDLKSPYYNKDAWTIPAVSASAVRDTAGKIHTGLTNADPNRSISLQITGLKGTRVSGRIITAPTMDARNTFEKPTALTPAKFEGAQLRNGTLQVLLPPKSVVMLDLE
ncbi:MAG: alpha-N-arabinofuranosidase, partial [Acidobacteria bacterium]|nr:alpha-N-arabinofuranosidase [Acidobacteriota bacterium]